MAARKQRKQTRSGRGSVEGEGLDETRGVFMISVAAELAEMHPQTLRMYEARGLITPQRSAKNTRLYSQRDETVLELEQTVERMRSELGRMRHRAAEMERRFEQELEQVRRSLKAEIVPYGAYDVISGDEAPVRIPVERPGRSPVDGQDGPKRPSPD